MCIDILIILQVQAKHINKIVLQEIIELVTEILLSYFDSRVIASYK
jgi:hypothetical protein